MAAPTGIAPIHWRLLTSHVVDGITAARMMLAFYRKRWIIEEFFRTLKTAGFQIEDAAIGDPHAMLQFTALAAIATVTVTVTQLVGARDNPSGQSMSDAFEPGDQPVIEAINKRYEGPTPTERQTNPHPTGTMAYPT